MKSTQKVIKNEWNITWKALIASCIYGPILVFQYVNLFFQYNEWGLLPLAVVGWSSFILVIILGWLPMWTFHKHGKVENGKSYVYTTRLVTKGIYSVLRHPQYTCGIVMTIGLTCLIQTWSNVILSAIIIPLIYYDTKRADKNGIGKFGDEYKEYMKKVPRVNFFLGVYRQISQRLNHSS